MADTPADSPLELLDQLPTVATDPSTLATLARAEFEQAVTLAHQYPRSITNFIKEASALVTLNQEVAAQCNYALPRDGKKIMGPSARFAEIIMGSWRNCQAGAQVVDEGRNFVVAQGVFVDMERITKIDIKVQRRITTKNGKRFGDDMIAVTGNAASSIAMRNAILRGIPKAFWEGIYQKALATIRGDYRTLHERRQAAVQEFSAFGVTPDMMLAAIGRDGMADVVPDDLVVLFGLLTTLKNGEATPDELFPSVTPKPESRVTPKSDTPKPAPKAEPKPEHEPEPEPESEDPSPQDVQDVQDMDEQTQVADEGPALANLTKAKRTALQKRIEAVDYTVESACEAVGVTWDNLTVDGHIALVDFISDLERHG